LTVMKQLPPSSTAHQGSGELIDASALVMPETHPGMSLAQIIAIIRFYWKFALMIAAAVVFLSAVIIKFLPRTYTATATLIVDRGKTDPLAAVANLSNAEMTGHLATQLELIQSPVILLRVVDRMQLTQDKEFAAGFNGHDSNGLREYTEKNLAQSLNVAARR